MFLVDYFGGYTYILLHIDARLLNRFGFSCGGIENQFISFNPVLQTGGLHRGDGSTPRKYQPAAYIY
ncbi:MAG: hypothetical protein M9933_17855 [Chitinophagaceae bacterium]|nr:hypothetical protein [Chitinophagaceae bacterium]